MKYINTFIDNNQRNLLYFMLILAIIYFIFFNIKIKKRENFSDKVIDFSKNDYNKYIDRPNKNEEKILNNLNNVSNKIHPDNDLKSIDTIIKKTTSVLLEIINDMVNIDKLESNGDSYIQIYVYYFKNFIDIIFRDGRLFYVGVVMIFLAIIVSFIDISK